MTVNDLLLSLLFFFFFKFSNENIIDLYMYCSSNGLHIVKKNS